MKTERPNIDDWHNIQVEVSELKKAVDFGLAGTFWKENPDNVIGQIDRALDRLTVIKKFLTSKRKTVWKEHAKRTALLPGKDRDAIT